MILQYYVIESVTGKHINIEVDAASKDDLEITRGGWQTVWDTDFILVKSLRWVLTVFGKEA